MEENQEKPKSTGKTVTIIILIVLLLGLGAYTAYDKLVLDKNTKTNLEVARDDLEIANREKKEANDKLNEIKTENSTKSTNLNNINLYSAGTYHAEYAYEGKMYIVSFKEKEDNEEEMYDLSDLMASNNYTKSSSYYNIKDLDIEEDKVEKVVTTNNFYTSDAQEFIYIIFKDGSVKRYNHDGCSSLSSIKGDYVLKNYKVKDIKVSCPGGWESCRALTYKLTLQDGTTKQIKEK